MAIVLEKLTKEEVDKLLTERKAHFICGPFAKGVWGGERLIVGSDEVYVRRGDLYHNVPEEEGNLM